MSRILWWLETREIHKYVDMTVVAIQVSYLCHLLSDWHRDVFCRPDRHPESRGGFAPVFLAQWQRPCGGSFSFFDLCWGAGQLWNWQARHSLWDEGTFHCPGLRPQTVLLEPVFRTALKSTTSYAHSFITFFLSLPWLVTLVMEIGQERIVAC